jgi:hypothetical protein
MLAPRFTRAVGWIFVINAISDILNLLYETAVDMSQKSSDVLEAKAKSASADD